ncbi:multidrug effflux MFS transporter [Sporolactobacillus terrae]|uniref:Bcr/CflA family efflux transporter n=1 Tax=Sporolactobacillus terrae TaxID=269673 RepID=A0A5K7WZN5_9BACL|nr:multidrug effflux MFS transporter [Sporolactobacillus terrae]BBO00096.1 Bcr/CflA family drug resistance efflux transporter [Sporolactobacillus terrae]
MQNAHTGFVKIHKRKGSYRRFVLVLGALSAFGPLSMDMYLPALPSLTKDFVTTPSFAQLSITACLVGLALGQIIVGPLSDRYGRKMPLLIGLATFAVTSFLCAMTTSILLLIVLRLIQGTAGAAGMVISRAIARDLYSGTKLTKFFSMLMAVNGLFPILAPIMGGVILRFASWRGVFIVLCVIGFLLLASAWAFIPETLPEGKRISGGLAATRASMGGMIRDRRFIGYALVLGLVMGAMFCYISGSSFVLQEMFSVSPQGFSVFFAANGLGIVLMSQLAGLLAGRIDAHKILYTGVILAALGGVMLFTSTLLDPPRLIAVMIPLFLIVSMVGLVNATAFSLAMQTQAKAAGSASAILGLGMNTIGALFSPLVGLGGSHTYVPMAVMILICELSALLIGYLLIRKPRAADDKEKRAI